MRTFAWAVFFALVVGGVAFGCQADAAPVVADTGLKGLIKGLLTGALVGLGLSYLGYWKDTDPAKKFDFAKAAPTIIFGAIVGALQGWDQKDISNWVDLKDNLASVIVAELLGKIGYRTAAPTIGNVVSNLLGRKTA